jgi:hypothetical protein
MSRQLFVSTRFDNAESILAPNWLEIQSTSNGSEKYFCGNYEQLVKEKELRSDVRDAGLQLGNQRRFDPWLVPVSTVPMIVTGNTDEAQFNILIKLDDFTSFERSNGVRSFQYRAFGDIYEQRFSDTFGGMPTQRTMKLGDAPNLTSWEKSSLYSIVQTSWQRIGDGWYPKEAGLKFWANGQKSKNNRNEWTEVWRFTWLDPDRVEKLLEDKSVVKTLADQPPTTSIFDSLKKYALNK